MTSVVVLVLVLACVLILLRVGYDLAGAIAAVAASATIAVRVVYRLATLARRQFEAE